MATEYRSDPDFQVHVADLKAGLLDQVSTEVLADVLRACPVSATGSNGNPPGYLRDHQRRAIRADTARVGSDVDYSVWVEDGHRVAYRNSRGEKVYTGEVVPPQPFLRPSIYRRAIL